MIPAGRRNIAEVGDAMMMLRTTARYRRREKHLITSRRLRTSEDFVAQFAKRGVSLADPQH